MDPIISLVLFVCVMVGTPGPANLLLMMGGARYGVRSCLPFVLGLILGKILLNLTIGLGVGRLLLEYPRLGLIMKLVSGGFIVWIAISSWNLQNKKNEISRFTWLTGMVVHPLNPKAWAMVTLAWSNFGVALGPLKVQLIIIPLCFIGVQCVFHVLWVMLGSLLGRALSHSLILNRILVLTTVGVVIGSMVAI